MVNIVYSPSLQAPILLSNPTGPVSLLSDASSVISQHQPLPLQGSVTMVGAAVRMALALSTLMGSLSMAGVAPTITRRTITTIKPTVGAVTSAGAAPTLATGGSAPALTFPRVALVGNGGDQSYGSNATTGYPQWTTAAAGSAANIAIQTIGAYDLAILSGVFEGWDTSGARDRENLAQALLKAATTYSIKLNNTRPTLSFFYHIMSEGNPSGSGTGYDQLIAQVNAMNGWMYESAGGVGTKTPSAFGNGAVLMNYSTAWPAGIGNALIGQSIVGANYGTTSNSPTGAQGIARMNGNYAADKLLIKGATGDTRWTFNAQMASPSAAGVFLDNCFAALDGAGTVANSSLDGINIFPGGQQGGGYPGLDTAQPLLARGIHNFFDQLQTMTATYGTAGKVYYNFGNIGQYANAYQFGTTTLTIGLENTMHGGVLESVMGAGAPSWEYQQTGKAGGGNWSSGWINVLADYYQGMDFCQAPKLLVLGIQLPATDGSTTSSWVNGGGTTLTTVTTGTALEYQLMRYGLCTTLLDDGYFGIGVGSPNNYDWSKPRWYDEFGDDSLTQVNVKRGYLGTPLTVRPTTATWPQGTMGVWSRSFTNGMAIVNPRGNGAQTVALPGTYTKLQGTQQPTINSGANVTSVTLADGDGIVLSGPIASASSPLSLPLATNAGSAFTYLGRFNMPSAFQFGGAAISVMNGVMYVGGIQQSQNSLGSVQLPTVAQIKAGGASATTIKSPIVVPGTIGQAASGSFSVAVGSAQYLGSLYISLGIFYGAGGPQTAWLVQANTGLTTFGTPQGMSPSVAGTLLSNFTGGIGYVPSLWQPILGGPLYVAGGIGLGIVNTQCCGFGISTFDPAFVKTTTNTVAVNQWLNYPYGGSSDGPGNAFNTTSLWNRPNAVGSMSGNTLTITSLTVNGTVVTKGATFQWSGGQDTISALGTGTGGAGTYTTAASHSVASTPIWISNTAVSPVTGVATGGNDLAAEYDGSLGVPIWIPGTRTLAFLNVHHYGPTYTQSSNSACDVGASGSRDPRRLQLTSYDLAQIVANKNAGNPLSAVQPYQFETFPNAVSLYGNCPGVLPEGCFNGFYGIDPQTNIMYGSALGMGGSTWYMDAWQIGSGPPPAPGYSTTFQTPQAVLSENNQWYNNGAPLGNGLTTCTVPSAGLCCGTSTGVATTQNPSGDDDSYALIRGFELYPQQFVQFTVKMKANLPQDGHSREIEGRLRCSQDNAGGLFGLECDVQYNDQAVPIVLWQGAPGVYTEAAGQLELNTPLANGDVIRFQITSANVLSGTQNGVSIGSVNLATDSGLKSLISQFAGGNPGIGFFRRGPVALSTDVGASAFSCGTF